MIAYSVLMFAIAALFFGLAIAIYRGNTNLIHNYHQTHINETDKKDYGKSFSKGLFLLAVCKRQKVAAAQQADRRKREQG